MSKLILSIILYFSFTITSIADDCVNTSFLINNNQTSSVEVSVKKNTFCRRALGRRDKVVTYTKIEVISKPKHGVAGTQSVYLFAYQPKKDFVGRDQFRLKVSWNNDRNVKESGLLDVFVDVK